MMTQDALFTVCTSSGSGLAAGPRFRKLGDALRYVSTHRTDASFAIRSPLGTWVRDSAGRSIFPRIAD